jgi:FtsZ-binding cell division protein ZapB
MVSKNLGGNSMNYENMSIDELKNIRKELAKEYSKARGNREIMLKSDIRKIEAELDKRKENANG